ncbi:Signal transduction histidine-protein kinase/phosphatase DegS [Cohnella sp. JJ-181]|nr:Signal transduction histidine-protein kinase/phosphatase DegS [Cohnella sp. JJ-181]
MQSKVEPYVLFEERNRIAEEIHDRICPHLFGITYAVHSAEQDWSGMSSEQHLDLLREIQQAAAEATRELRKTIYDLSASEHGDASWLCGVESLLASQAKLSGVRIRFRPPAPDRRVTVHHQKALYRIIAEATGNAIRHGKCSAVDVRLTLRRCSATLKIWDNGKGFDCGATRLGNDDSGHGLRNMKTLAAALGGSLQIDSEEGRGTCIVARLPLSDG